MEQAAAREHGRLRTLTPAERRRATRAAISAGRKLDHRLSALLSAVPSPARGPVPEDEKEPLTQPDFWLPRAAARFGRHPVLMALSADDDRPLDWLRAGQALQHALLAGPAGTAACGR